MDPRNSEASAGASDVAGETLKANLPGGVHLETTAQIYGCLTELGFDMSKAIRLDQQPDDISPRGAEIPGFFGE